jgi:carboxymethylenebutenolidase
MATALGEGQEVRFAGDGVAIRAYLAQPPGAAGTLPGVLIIHEWWGLNDHIMDLARRFARAGYAALAPDLYSRQGYQVTRDAQQAAKLMEGMSSQAALLDLNAATRFLKSRAGVDGQRLGVVGFCMGGTLALMMGIHNSDMKASVGFYGKVAPLETLARLGCPVLYHYGARDGWVTRKEIDVLQEGLSKFGKPGVVHTYPDAEHAFFNDTRPEVYSSADAELAWDRTLAFLREHLR